MQELLTIMDHSEASSFQAIAEGLMNGYYLRVRDKYYRIIDCEFYYYSKNHADPYVHGHQRQKESLGEWYFHGSGLDITLSNGDNYGGILIRGLVRVTNRMSDPLRTDAIDGPLNVCTEIFKQIGQVNISTLEFGLEKVPFDQQFPTKVYSCERVGLNSKDDEYFSQPYRFITYLGFPHKNIEKIRKKYQ
jgi:hypothetical protein